MKIFLVLGLVVYILFTTGCPKGCIDVNYKFSMNEIFYPEMDSIEIGDTLWMASNHSNVFIDSISGEQMDLTSTMLGTNIRILQLIDSSETTIGGINDFHIISIKGRESGNDNIPDENKAFFFDENDSSYQLKLAIIPIKEGVYMISVGNSLGVFNGKNSCKRISIEIRNANINSHLYLYQNSRPGYTISNYERTHIYCFVVR